MFQDIQGWLKSITDFGVAVILAAVVIDVIFPSEGYSIVENVSTLVGQFTGGGLTGLITLLLFMTFMRR